MNTYLANNKLDRSTAAKLAKFAQITEETCTTAELAVGDIMQFPVNGWTFALAKVTQIETLGDALCVVARSLRNSKQIWQRELPRDYQHGILVCR